MVSVPVVDSSMEDVGLKVEPVPWVVVPLLLCVGIPLGVEVWMVTPPAVLVAAPDVVETASDELPEELADTLELAPLLAHAAAAAAWALARSVALHSVIKHGPTMATSLAWVSGLQAHAVSSSVQSTLGRAFSRQGI